MFQLYRGGSCRLNDLQVDGLFLGAVEPLSRQKPLLATPQYEKVAVLSLASASSIIPRFATAATHICQTTAEALEGIVLVARPGAPPQRPKGDSPLSSQLATMAQPQTQPEEPPLPPRIAVIHNAALAGAIISPLVMLLPPRKMDIRFFVLAGAFSLSTNQLAYEYTGTSIYSRSVGRLNSVFNVDNALPEGAQRTRQLLKEQRERDAAEKRRLAGEAEKKAQEGGIKALGRDIWMGSETEGWQQRRAEEHKKQLEEGKTISDLIADQISDVFKGNWGSKKSESAEKSNPDNSDRPEKK